MGQIQMIHEVQRCVFNLHAEVSNYLNPTNVIIEGKATTLEDINEYMENQVHRIQDLLRSLEASLQS
jgi:hypothetical protein